MLVLMVPPQLGPWIAEGFSVARFEFPPSSACGDARNKKVLNIHHFP